VTLKYSAEKMFSGGVPPRTPLRQLMTLPRRCIRLGRATPLHQSPLPRRLRCLDIGASFQRTEIFFCIRLCSRLPEKRPIH